jgi:hypothetical protein
MAFKKKALKGIEKEIFNNDDSFTNQIKNCESVKELEIFLSSNIGSVSTEVVQIFFNFINP